MTQGLLQEILKAMNLVKIHIKFSGKGAIWYVHRL